MNQIWPSPSRSGRGVLVAAASIAVLVAPGLAGAETYDLATCTSLALRNTLTAEQARTNLQSAEAGVTGARSGFLPRLSVSGSWTKPETTTEQIGGEFIVFDDSYWSGGANASWTLFDGLGTWNSWKSARYGRDAAEEAYRSARQDVVYQTESRYVDVLEKQELLEVARRAKELSQEQLKKTEAMRELGAATLADVYKAQVDHQNNLLSELQAERDLRVAKASLATYMGLDALAEIDLVADSPGQDTQSTLADSIERAMEVNPDLRAARSRELSGKHDVRAARSNNIPSLSLFASGSYFNTELSSFDDDHTDYSYGVRMSWTVFDGLLTKSNIRRSQATLANSRRQLEDTERQVRFLVSQSWYDLEVARRAIEVAQVAVQSSEEDHRLAQERFRIGEGTILDVIDARVNLTRTSSELVSARYTARLAAAALRNAIGELEPPAEANATP